MINEVLLKQIHTPANLTLVSLCLIYLVRAERSFQFVWRGTVSTGIDGIDQRLAHLLEERDVVEEDEIIPPEELEESEAAWQDYLAGRDPGV